MKTKDLIQTLEKRKFSFWKKGTTKWVGFELKEKEWERIKNTERFK